MKRKSKPSVNASEIAKLSGILMEMIGNLEEYCEWEDGNIAWRADLVMGVMMVVMNDLQRLVEETK